MRIATVVGARPQLVKLLPLSNELRRRFEEIVIHTGQHYDDTMSGVFVRELGLPEPDYDLAVGSAPHGRQTGRMLEALEKVLDRIAPQLVVAIGDTNSTLAAALAASKMGILLVHIEAGLRCFDRSMPEEINRLVADSCSDHLFAPTRTAMNNLEREGLSARAVLTGDLMVDSLDRILSLSSSSDTLLDGLGVGGRPFDLLTLHRSANVDDPARLRALLSRLRRPPRPVVFPVHPRTRNAMATFGVRLPEGIIATAPLGPIDFVALERRATKIITDSGGVQREAYLLGVPCVVLRRETEWVELVEAGWSILADPSTADIVSILECFDPDGERPEVLGAGVAKRMVEQIGRILEGATRPLS